MLHDDVARSERLLLESLGDGDALLDGERRQDWNRVEKDEVLRLGLLRNLPRELPEGLAVEHPHHGVARRDHRRGSRGLEHQRDLSEDVARGFRVDLDLGASAIAKHVESSGVYEVHLGSHVAFLDHALVRRDFQHGHLSGHGVAHGLCELVEDHRVLEGGFDEVDLVVVRLAARGGFGLGGCAPRGSHVEPFGHALRTELGHLLVVAVLADAHDALRGGPLSLGRVRRAVAPIGPAGGVGVGANLGFVLLVLLVLRLGRAAELVRLAVIHRLFTQARTHRDATIGLASLVDSREGVLLFGRRMWDLSSVECGRARSNACVWIAGARQWRSAATQLVAECPREGSGEPSRPRTHRGVAARPGRPFVETRDGRILVPPKPGCWFDPRANNESPCSGKGRVAGGSLGLESRP